MDNSFEAPKLRYFPGAEFATGLGSVEAIGPSDFDPRFNVESLEHMFADPAGFHEQCQRERLN